MLFGINNVIVNALSYSKVKRYLHFRLIIVAFILAIAVSNYVAGPRLIVLIGNLISLPSVKQVIYSIIPATIVEVVGLLVCTILLNTLYAAVLLVALFIAKKIIFRKKDDYHDYSRFSLVEKIFRFPWKIVNRFYENDNNEVILKAFGYPIGVCFKYMKYVCVIIWFAEILLMTISLGTGIMLLNGLLIPIVKRFYLLPLALFFLFEQIQLFLEGPEREKIGAVSSVDISEKMMGDIRSLIPTYYSALGKDAILCAESRPDVNAYETQYHGNDILDEQLSNCNEPGVSEIIFGQIKQSGVEMNYDYQNSIIKLINGESVFVRDISGGEFTSYYSFYISYLASQGKSTLIVCADSEMVSDVREELNAKFLNANGTSILCEIATFGELNSETHANVIICTYHELLDLNLDILDKDMPQDFCFVVFPDSFRFVNLDSVSRRLLVGKLKTISDHMNYAFISCVDGNVRGILNDLFFYDDIELESFRHDYRSSDSGVMVWKSESIYSLQSKLEIGNSGSSYMGTVLPIALVAIRNDFPKVFTIEGSNSADAYYLNNASESNMLEIYKYLNIRVDLKNTIVSSLTEMVESEDMKVICVYDDANNIISTLHMWFKYAGNNGAIIHVISPHYMVREYFADNYKVLVDSDNPFDALITSDLCTYRNRMINLLTRFISSDVDEKSILELANRYNWKLSGTVEILLAAVQVLHKEAHNFFNYFEFVDDYYFDTTNGVIKTRKVHLISDTLKCDLFNIVSSAKVKMSDNVYHELNILKGNVLNYYLPKQLMTIDGKFYQITQIDKNGLIYVQSTKPQTIYDYYTISDFSIVKADLISDLNDETFDFNIYEAVVSRNIRGYIYSENGNDFSNLNRFLNESRVVQKECVPVLEIRIKKHLFNNDEVTAQKAVKLLSVLFNGLFKTIFPELYQNLIAVANTRFDEALCHKILTEKADHSIEDLVKLYVGGVNESCINHDNDDCVSLYIIEFSSVEYGMVDVLYQKIKEVFGMIFDYLNWYLSSDKGRYLHFGCDSIPSIFAADELKSVLQNAYNLDDSIDLRNDCIEEAEPRKFKKYSCTFCGKEAYFAWEFGDGRIICGNCHKQVKTQAEEIKQIFEDIKLALIRKYHINLPNSINIRFQSKDAIERVAGKCSDGRIVGFYNEIEDTKQIWIERKGPSVAMKSTMVHELTHAWQYGLLKKDKMKALMKSLGMYKEKKKKLLLEGHAVYTQILAMDELGEAHFSKVLKVEYSRRNDIYGIGYKLISEYCETKKDLNPYQAMESLIDEIIKGADVIKWPDNIKDL